VTYASEERQRRGCIREYRIVEQRCDCYFEATLGLAVTRVIVPRCRLGNVLHCPDSAQTGVYVLHTPADVATSSVEVSREPQSKAPAEVIDDDTAAE
jgi:hypothetical protein